MYRRGADGCRRLRHLHLRLVRSSLPPFGQRLLYRRPNHWYCKKCYEEWLARAEWYPEDADVERRNFNFYAPRIGVKCQ